MIKIVPGLLATGKPARNFSPDGRGHHAEGLVVDFDGEWHGNFARGKTNHDVLYTQFAPKSVHVISGGNHYIVDYASRKSNIASQDWIGASVFSETSAALIVFDLTHAISYQGHHKLWESERISWDGLRSISEAKGKIHGEGYDPFGDAWVHFELDPLTGMHSGSGYPT